MNQGRNGSEIDWSIYFFLNINEQKNICETSKKKKKWNEFFTKNVSYKYCVDFLVKIFEQKNFFVSMTTNIYKVSTTVSVDGAAYIDIQHFKLFLYDDSSNFLWVSVFSSLSMCHWHLLIIFMKLFRLVHCTYVTLKTNWSLWLRSYSLTKLKHKLRLMEHFSMSAWAWSIFKYCWREYNQNGLLFTSWLN